MKMNVFKVAMLFAVVLNIGILNGSENKFFNIVNLNLRDKPSLKAKKILTVQEGSIFKVLKKTNFRNKIDVFNEHWYEIDYKGNKGWVFGGYLVEYEGQKIDEFIKRYKLIRYFKDGKLWGNGEDKTNITCDLYLGFISFDKKLNERELELDIQVSKDSLIVLSLTIPIGSFEYKKNDYYLYAKEGRTLKGDITGKWRKGDLICVLSVKNNFLTVKKIEKILSKRNEKKFNTFELNKLKFKLDYGRRYWKRNDFE